jgi:putative transposase
VALKEMAPMTGSRTASDDTPIPSCGEKSSERWHEAQRRAAVIRPLAERDRCPRHLVKAAAADLGLGERHVYTLVGRWREAGGELATLLPRNSDGGKGKSRIPSKTDAIIRRVIDDVYVGAQRISAETVIREVCRQCRQEQVSPPAPCTIRRRLNALSSEKPRVPAIRRPPTRVAREDAPASCHPFDLVQVEHSKLDLKLVDPIDRQPVGQPWLTLAIDVYSRCIAGLNLTLDPPSAACLGLCLTHVVSEKKPWLKAHGVEADWPVMGAPRRLSVSDGAQFRSQDFERGCARHGIRIERRPTGAPHYGGVVKLLVGTLMELIHPVPTATRLNDDEPSRDGGGGLKCLTLGELERWLAIAITKYYHVRPSAGLGGDQPLRCYEAGVLELAAGGACISIPKDRQAFRVDFLPAARRTLQRRGVTLGHIDYHSHALAPWVKKQGAPNPLSIRRDPYDLSKIYVLDGTGETFLEVPYRNLQRPKITLWEHRLALRRLRAGKRGKVDEGSLYAAVAEMRAIGDDLSSGMSTMPRRFACPGGSVDVRSGGLSAFPSGSRASPVSVNGGEVFQPFDDIEEW